MEDAGAADRQEHIVDGPERDTSKVARQDADDRGRLRAQGDRFADHVGAPAERALPVAVAEDRHQVRVGAIVGGRQQAADARR